MIDQSQNDTDILMNTQERNEDVIIPEVKQQFKPTSMINGSENNSIGSMQVYLTKNGNKSKFPGNNNINEVNVNKDDKIEDPVKNEYDKNNIEDNKAIFAYKVVDMIIKKKIDKDVQIEALFNLIKFFQNVLVDKGIDPVLVMKKIDIFGDEYKEFEMILILK